MLEPGSLIAGKLRIERILGEGGMGVVAVATHVGLDQRVAVKVLHGELAKQPEVVQRFVREARAAAKLTSDHVCRVNDVGALEGGEPYIEMELLEGEDLAHLIARAPIAPEVAAEYIAQSCVALAQAHAMGIVHRDLKPANLFVTTRLDGAPLIKVLDFGIATAPSGDDFKITKTAMVMGSPGYMSPEHLRSARDVDARSDIWSLGVILYEAVTGRLPFAASSITELAVKVVMDEPAVMDGIDPRYAAVVARCLKKPAEERFQSVADLAAALGDIGGARARATAQIVAHIAAGGGSRAHDAVAVAETAMALQPVTMATVPPAPIAKSPTTLGASASESAVPAQKWRGPLAAVLAAAGAIAAGAVVFAAVHRSAPAEHAPKLAAARPADAAIARPDAAAAVDPKREALHELAEAKDYAGILVLQDLDQSDPETKSIVAEAKREYVAQAGKEIAEHVAHGECAAAKLAIDEAHKLAGDTSLDGAAATCGAKAPAKPAAGTGTAAGTATAASSSASASAPSPTVEQAVDAYTRGDYTAALAAAQKALVASPHDTSAIATATRSACALHDAAAARTYFERLPADERVAVITLCKREGVEVIPPEVTQGVEDALRAARDASNRGDWRAAETAAKRAADREPNNLRAIHALAVAACHNGDTATLAELHAHETSRTAFALRHTCDRGGERDRDE